MNARFKYNQEIPQLMKKLIELAMAAKENTFDPKTIDLVNIRASQVNGCAFCVDMHSKEAKIHGERELRLYHICIWRESPLFSEKERAILEWTEAVTQLGPHGISDEIYNRVSAQLSDKELSHLTFIIGIINFFNRMNIASPNTPGSLDKMFGLDKAGLN